MAELPYKAVLAMIGDGRPVSEVAVLEARRRHPGWGPRPAARVALVRRASLTPTDTAGVVLRLLGLPGRVPGIRRR